MTASALAVRLDRVRRSSAGGYSARCPAHQDRDPSLTFRDGHSGILVKCWAGCDLTDIAAALGLRVGDLFHHRGSQRPKSGWLSRPPDEWTVIWSQTLRRAVEQGHWAAEWGPYFFASDHVRRCAHLAHEARHWATLLGPDDPRTWPLLLERAAAVEREGLSVEAELDAILAEGRIGL